jgi:hypothetical protein
MTGVYSRTVLALERHYRAGVTVVWTRKRPERPCRCSLTEWRRWARRGPNAFRASPSGN